MQTNHPEFAGIYPRQRFKSKALKQLVHCFASAGLVRLDFVQPGEPGWSEIAKKAWVTRRMNEMFKKDLPLLGEEKAKEKVMEFLKTQKAESHFVKLKMPTDKPPPTAKKEIPKITLPPDFLKPEPAQAKPPEPTPQKPAFTELDAQKLGEEAFKKGLGKTPGLDMDMKAGYAKTPEGTKALPFIKAWYSGYEKAQSEGPGAEAKPPDAFHLIEAAKKGEEAFKKGMGQNSSADAAFLKHQNIVDPTGLHTQSLTKAWHEGWKKAYDESVAPKPEPEPKKPGYTVTDVTPPGYGPTMPEPATTPYKEKDLKHQIAYTIGKEAAKTGSPFDSYKQLNTYKNVAGTEAEKEWLSHHLQGYQEGKGITPQPPSAPPSPTPEEHGAVKGQMDKLGWTAKYPELEKIAKEQGLKGVLAWVAKNGVPKVESAKVPTPEPPKPEPVVAKPDKPVKGYVSEDFQNAYSSIAVKTGVDSTSLKAALAAASVPIKSSIASARVKVAEAVYDGAWKPNAESPGAFIVDHQDSVKVKGIIQSKAVGNTAQAVKEMAEMPAYDIQMLSQIEVLDTEAHGKANFSPSSFKVQFGTSSMSGDYRHETGHAVMQMYKNANSPIASAVMADWAANRKKLQELKKDPSFNPKGYKELEEKAGMISVRCGDTDHEYFAEHYRAFHRAIYQDRHEGGNGAKLTLYKQRHPVMAKVLEAHYTAAYLQHSLNIS